MQEAETSLQKSRALSIAPIVCQRCISFLASYKSEPDFSTRNDAAIIATQVSRAEKAKVCIGTAIHLTGFCQC